MNNPTTGMQAAAPVPFAGAVLLMVFSVTFFTVSHGAVRGVGSTIHPFEIAFFTSLFSFFIYLPWLVRSGFKPLRTTKLRWHIVRAFINAGAVATWYMALTVTPLADATALGLTGPLFVTLGGILFIGEPAQLRRWTGLGVGLLGALVIVRPGFEAFSIGFLYVFVSVIMSSGSRIFAKLLTRWDSPGTIGALVALLQIPITLIMAAPYWQWPDLTQWGLLAAIGLLVGGAHFTMAAAYSRADVGALEPLNFMRLIIAALIGFFIFSEVPDLWTWIGGAVIITATSYIARREAVKSPGLKTPPNDPL